MTLPAAPAAPRARLIALGASNLTRGLPAVLDAARAAANGPVEVLAALGHGRSFGIDSRLLGRTLPGIDGCGLWRALAAAPELPGTGLVMDVGNDLLYGQDVPTILGWVDRALARLRPRVGRLLVAEMPIHTIRTLGPRRYAFFRRVLFPRCRIPLAEMQQLAEALHAGLARLAAQHGATLVPLQRAWYGFDPIHVRLRDWPAACCALLGLAGAPDDEWGRGLWRRWRLLRAAPELSVRFGHERRAAQPIWREADGTVLSLF